MSSSAINRPPISSSSASVAPAQEAAGGSNGLRESHKSATAPNHVRISRDKRGDPVDSAIRNCGCLNEACTVENAYVTPRGFAGNTC